ncbi:beta-lactamase [Bryobacterales bacterium F-183]|nr:beta-lactamase [Bryobacterales bacterium F-183]
MRVCFLLLCTVGLSFGQTTFVERELERVSKVSGGVVGATAVHIETGRRISIRGTEGFPMASTVKVPLAVHLLARVDAGQERLDRMIELQPADLHPGSGTLTALFNKPGVALSVRNLLELMLLISDNSATDILLREVGGGNAVVDRMKSLGIDGIQVSRPTLALIADAVGVTLDNAQPYTIDAYAAKSKAVTAEQRAAARRTFEADPRDTSTPDGMTALLVKLYKGQLLKPESTALLLDIMDRCRTGDLRLKGMLPAGTKVAHKTGTILGTANDVGIITLPEDRGHVAISVFVKNSTLEEAEKDRGIAEVARTAYSYFLFGGMQ